MQGEGEGSVVQVTQYQVSDYGNDARQKYGWLKENPVKWELLVVLFQIAFIVFILHNSSRFCEQEEEQKVGNGAAGIQLDINRFHIGTEVQEIICHALLLGP